MRSRHCSNPCFLAARSAWIQSLRVSRRDGWAMRFETPAAAPKATPALIKSRLVRLESIESSRILDQDHAARRGIRNPDGDQVQDVPVIGLQQRGEICVLAARTRRRIRM